MYVYVFEFRPSLSHVTSIVRQPGLQTPAHEYRHHSKASTEESLYVKGNKGHTHFIIVTRWGPDPMRLGYLLMNQKYITIAIAGSVHTHNTFVLKIQIK